MNSYPSNALYHAFRLPPKSDLRKSLLDFAKNNKITAGSIVTCVGSLEEYNIRFANQQNAESQKGFFEIVSLTGTISKASCHLHISIADASGHVIGGHLMNGNFVYTTAEITVVELTNLEFTREVDPTYGFHELVITSKKN